MSEIVSTVLAVLGVLVPVVIFGGCWLLRRWDEISTKLDDISTKLDKPETGPTRGEISTKLDDISTKLDELETGPTRGEISTKLDVHGEMLADLEKGQTDMVTKLKGISTKLAGFQPKS